MMIYNVKKRKISLLTEYINEAGSIVNPDGGELADYAKMYETLDNIIQKLANKLKESKYKN